MMLSIQQSMQQWAIDAAMGLVLKVQATIKQGLEQWLRQQPPCLNVTPFRAFLFANTLCSSAGAATTNPKPWYSILARLVSTTTSTNPFFPKAFSPRCQLPFSYILFFSAENV
jgi:hypothetical protein